MSLLPAALAGLLTATGAVAQESYTVPVWVLDGALFDSPTEEAPPMPPTETMRDTNPYRSLIVYAQSGDILDVNSTSSLRRTAPTLLSWADVSP